MKREMRKRMLPFLLACCLLLTALPAALGAAAAGETETKTAVDLIAAGELRMLGRTMTVDDTAQSFDWQGAGFTFIYEGSGDISAAIEITTDVSLVVSINGEETRPTLKGSGVQTLQIAKDLPEGTYTIRVVRTSDPVTPRLSQLNSLTYSKGAKLTATPEGPYKFEVLGDSITANDFYDAYASLAFRSFGAEANYMAIAGRGLISGTLAEDNWSPDRTKQIKQLFPKTSYFRDPTVDWDFSQYQPDVLVINLGTNDGISDEFVQALHDFILECRELYPDTHICYAFGFMNNNEEQLARLEATINEINETDGNVSYLHMPYVPGGAHPNFEQNREGAEILIEHLAKILGVEAPESVGVDIELENATRYESEQAAYSQGAWTEGDQWTTSYSGGKVVTGMGPKNGGVANASLVNEDWSNIAWVKYTVTVPKTARYQVALAGVATPASGEPYVRAYAKVGADAPLWEWYKLDFEYSAWNNSRATQVITVILEEGENEIWVSGSARGTGSSIVYDYIDVAWLDDDIDNIPNFRLIDDEGIIYSDNYLQNPGFEEATDTGFAGWKITGDGLTDVGVVKEGENSLSWWAEEQTDLTLEQTVTGLDAGYYDFSLFMQGGDGEDTSITLTATCGGREFTAQGTVDGYLNWNKATVKGIVVNAGQTLILRVHIKGANNFWGSLDEGTLYFMGELDPDDITEPTSKGDVNGDGLVNSSDARLVLQYTVDLAELGEAQLEQADVSGDGQVNSTDARMILQSTVAA